MLSLQSDFAKENKQKNSSVNVQNLRQLEHGQSKFMCRNFGKNSSVRFHIKETNRKFLPNASVGKLIKLTKYLFYSFQKRLTWIDSQVINFHVLFKHDYYYLHVNELKKNLIQDSFNFFMHDSFIFRWFFTYDSFIFTWFFTRDLFIFMWFCTHDSFILAYGSFSIW